MTCPHCEWPEFTPVRRVTRIREDVLGRLLGALRGRPLAIRTGDIVCCARCTTQYVISRGGSYKIRGAEPERPKLNGHAKPDNETVENMADQDIPWDT